MASTCSEHSVDTYLYFLSMMTSDFFHTYPHKAVCFIAFVAKIVAEVVLSTEWEKKWNPTTSVCKASRLEAECSELIEKGSLKKIAAKTDTSDTNWTEELHKGSVWDS